MSEPIRFAKAGSIDLVLLPAMANRHGVVTGATGTGKTVSLQALSEAFSDRGVPVFVSDVKGDLAGLAAAGGGNEKVDKRLSDLSLPPLDPISYPVVFWDVFGERGHPVRCTVSEMGPLLLARLMDLNDTQTGVMQIAFAYADDQGLPLVDLNDIRALLQEVNLKRKELSMDYGSVSPASVGAIQRGLLRLDEAGADQIFGEPALDIHDFLSIAPDGRGRINILAAEKLFLQPTAYATFLLWLLSELYETMPEVGDLEQPRMVFFFDEAHLLFDDLPKALGDRIEQVIRLIRSKGIGIFFVTQMPIDIPEVVVAQLGNRIQHALRAYTPRDQKAIKAVAETFRVNESFDVEATVTNLEVGEALISFLDESGAPSVVERGMVIPPRSRIGVLTDQERQAVIMSSPFYGKYETVIDRETAYEILRERTAQAALVEQQRLEEEAASKQAAAEARKKPKKSAAGDVLDDVVRGTSYTVGREIGRSLIRGVLGGLKR